MLTNEQKQAIRLLIERKPQSDYMQQLAASDQFAISEIQINAPKILAEKNEAVINNRNQAGILAREMAQLRSDIALITRVANAE